MDTLGNVADVAKDITFFVTETIEREAVSPIADVAVDRGYDVTFSEDLYLDAEIGVYPQDPNGIPPVDDELSIVMFHGIDQGYSPNMWPGDDWSEFDLGLLPGPYLSDKWRSQSWYPQARPNVGVFEVGWPKSDYVFSDDFEERVWKKRANMEIPDGTTTLYAPSIESHGKIHDFIDRAEDVVDTMLVKHAPYDHEGKSNSYRQPFDELYSEYEDHDDVYIIDKNDDVFVAMALADILVSENSSVLQEAVLTDTVPVSVTDWPHRGEPRITPKNQVPGFAIMTESNGLSDVLADIVHNYSEHLETIRDSREYHYSHLGTSSEVVVDLIDSVVAGSQPPVDPLTAERKRNAAYLYYLLMQKLERAYKFTTFTMMGRMSENTKQTAKRYRLDIVYSKLKEFLKQYRKQDYESEIPLESDVSNREN